MFIRCKDTAARLPERISGVRTENDLIQNQTNAIKTSCCKSPRLDQNEINWDEKSIYVSHVVS